MALIRIFSALNHCLQVFFPLYSFYYAFAEVMPWSHFLTLSCIHVVLNYKYYVFCCLICIETCKLQGTSTVDTAKKGDKIYEKDTAIVKDGSEEEGKSIVSDDKDTKHGVVALKTIDNNDVQAPADGENTNVSRWDVAKEDEMPSVAPISGNFLVQDKSEAELSYSVDLNEDMNVVIVQQLQKREGICTTKINKDDWIGSNQGKDKESFSPKLSLHVNAEESMIMGTEFFDSEVSEQHDSLQSLEDLHTVHIQQRELPQPSYATLVHITERGTFQASKFEVFFPANHEENLAEPCKPDVIEIGHSNSVVRPYWLCNFPGAEARDERQNSEIVLPTIITTGCSTVSNSSITDLSSNNPTHSVDICSLCGYRHGRITYLFENQSASPTSSVNQSSNSLCNIADESSDLEEDSEDASASPVTLKAQLEKRMTSTDIGEFFADADVVEETSYPHYTTVITTADKVTLETEV